VQPGPIVVHASDEAQAERAWRRLYRVGLDDVRGFVLTPPAEPATLLQIDAIDLFAPAGDGRWQVADVRRSAEFAKGHVPGAVHWELHDAMHEHVPAGLDPARPTALLCEGGYRSRAAAHLARAAGFRKLANVADGMPGWRQNHLPLTASS
jgi:rhodanese-related sulfurtransferase